MTASSRAARTLLWMICILLLACAQGWSWGPSGHTLVTEYAIALLPAQVKPFYDANSRTLVALSTLPDDWKDTHKDETAAHHYINLDALDDPPFARVIGDRETVENRLGRDNVWKAGVLPWIIAERYQKLVQALSTGDHVEAVVQSSLLAHFVADAHVPLHVTKFYDGKTPEQKGLHFRWEEALPALMLNRADVRPTAPAKLDDILSSAFEWCVASYEHVDAICRADDKAREIDPGHAYTYYRTMSAETGTILSRQLTQAAEALAGVYVAAWREAGKPDLPAKAAPLFWGQ